MFDVSTQATISSVPHLRDLDPADLPKRLSDAALRVALAGSLLKGREDVQAELISDSLVELSSIASAFEVLALEGNADQRSACAFVAAYAHQVRGELRQLSLAQQLTVAIEVDSIPPEISATLLFLIADSPADAADCSALIREHTNDEVGAQLASSIRALARSRLEEIADRRAAIADIAPTEASDALYLLILRAMVDWSARMIGDSQVGDQLGFRQLADLASQQMNLAGSELETADVATVLVGPWHLARLLALAEEVLSSRSMLRVPSPPQVPEQEWRDHLKRLSRRRPWLWRNHAEAISQGFLLRGQSAVASFPTGAGKSTVSELKVASVAMAGETVIVLVPTLTLVDQTATALRAAMPAVGVVAQKDAGLETWNGLASVFVLTPESCLASMTLGTSDFGSVGLIYFDEAHLLHGESSNPSRRSIDATMCLLALMAAHPAADILLISAMIENAEELSDWLKETTGRPCLALDDPWKPTRQARAAVVYNTQDLDPLRQRLQDAFRDSTTAGPPAAVKQQLNITPFGFFGLRSTWDTTALTDYAMLRLTPDAVRLTANGDRTTGWYLSANANKVGARIAATAAQVGTKTIVFSQRVDWAVAISRDIATQTRREVELDRAELRLALRAVDKLGADDALFAPVEDGRVSSVLPHHGLLLPEERRLHERLFRRRGGADVLVATSTLSQGMNLPTELVVIAGDRRFDDGSDRMARIAAHELLNAAGRAGRAGEHSTGLVIVVPNSVIGFDSSGNTMYQRWFELQEVFARSDQCLSIHDPIEGLLQLAQDPTSDAGQYFLRRISDGDGPTSISRVLDRSLAAYHARKRGETDWSARWQQMIEALDLGEGEATRLAGTTGIPRDVVQNVIDALKTRPVDSDDAMDWVDWFFQIVADNPEAFARALRASTLSQLRGAEPELSGFGASPRELMGLIERLSRIWMEGGTLADVQNGGALGRDPKLILARKYLLRVVPDVSYLMSLPGIILQYRGEEAGLSRLLADCLEEGVDSAAKLEALRSNPMTLRSQLR